jgi:uncharacterized damage-inducible protein DinB
VSETFEKRDMVGTVFRNVNLHQATFDDVNLEGASIRNANLKDFSIDDAYIKGLTIYGLRVDQLIEAELDRRDPERLRLRMADPHDPDSVLAVMKRLDEVRGQFYQALRASDAQLLTTSPGPGRWSVLELVRHLLFAEDLYLNRWILRNDAPWNALGQKPAFLEHDAAYDDVGSAPTEDLEAVLAAWEALHAQTWEFLAGLTAEELQRDTSEVDFGQRTVGGVLQGLARHDLGHIREAEALLDELGQAG